MSDSERQHYSYQPPCQIYALSFCTNPSYDYTLALGSFLKTQYNNISIIALNEESKAFEVCCLYEMTYPCTKIVWSPDRCSSLLASSGDLLRVLKYEGDSLTIRSNLITERKDSPPPLTSLDWNQANPSKIGTCSINTTCTIWDLEKESIIAHMIAHDQPVYDIAFSDSENVFATAGGDGSIRQFDLRNLESSTILYEKPDVSACLRLAWNKNEPNYLATITLDSSTIVVLDIRQASVPVYTLTGHSSCANTLAWSTIDGSHLITGADDHQAYLWDIKQNMSNIEPRFVYSTDSEINNIVWSYTQPEWIAISKNKDIDVLKI